VKRPRAPIVTLAVFVLLAAAAPWLVGDGGVGLLFEVLLMLAMAELWNLLAGYTGLVSMGLQCFVGLGGYTAIFAANTLSVSPYWVLPLAPLICGLVGAASALLLFRLRDAYFSISTWVFAEVVAMLVFIAPGLGHVTGMTLETTRGIDYETFLLANFWIAAALAAAVVAGIYLLLNATLGLGMLSVRDNEIAAASIGVNVWRNRFIAYVIAAAGCGLAGAISFMAALFITVTTAFDLNWVVAMIFIVIIGGIGTLEGPIIGTAVYYGIRELATNVLGLSGSWYLVALGSVAVVTMLVAPRGIWPFLRDRFGLEWLSVARKLPHFADGAPAGPPAAGLTSSHKTSLPGARCNIGFPSPGTRKQQ
jgi:branched-chain amino acid transport system permease protein